MQDSTFQRLTEVWNYILLYVYDPKNDGRTPTHREIVEALGFSSTSVLNRYMDELEKQGFIRSRVMGGHYGIAGATLNVPKRELKKPKRKRRKHPQYS